MITQKLTVFRFSVLRLMRTLFLIGFSLLFFIEELSQIYSIIGMGLLFLWIIFSIVFEKKLKNRNILGFIGFFIDLLICFISVFIFDSFPMLLISISVLSLNATLTFGYKVGLIAAVIGSVTYLVLLYFQGFSTNMFEKDIYFFLTAFISVGVGTLFVYEHSEKVEQNGENKLLSMSLLYDMVFELNSSLNYEHVLETALLLSLKAMTEDENERSRIVNAYFMEDNEVSGGFVPKTSRGLMTSDHRVVLACNQGVLVKLRNNNDLIVMENPQEDPELKRLLAILNSRSAVVFPLRYRRHFMGFFLFAHPDKDFFTKNRLEILDIILRQSVSSLQNAMLYDQIQIEKQRLIEVHSEAQKKLARDLHDGPTQSLAAISMRVNLSRRLLEKDVQAAAEELFKTENLARRTTKEMRHMLFTLRPLVLESKGLIAAVVSLAEKTQELYGQKIKIQIDDDTLEDMELGKQNVLFYIIDEAINNARKHAEAEFIIVKMIKESEDLVKLEIIDNGVGFDVNEMQKNYNNRTSSSLGMINLKERTEILNGVFSIDSAIGMGTTVKVLVPLTEDAAERIQKSY